MSTAGFYPRFVEPRLIEALADTPVPALGEMRAWLNAVRRYASSARLTCSEPDGGEMAQMAIRRNAGWLGLTERFSYRGILYVSRPLFIHQPNASSSDQGNNSAAVRVCRSEPA